MNTTRNFTISAFTENTPGILHRLTVIFTRRKVNIDSLTVSETERKGISRFTIVINTDEATATKIVKAVNRVIEVREVFASENKDLIYKEIAFVRVKAETPEKRLQIEDHVQRYGASIAYAEPHHLVLEKCGTEDEIDSLVVLLEPFGIKEFVRSGRIAILKRESAPHGKYEVI